MRLGARDSAVRCGPASQCQLYREQIESKLNQGLSVKRIYQDLRSDHGFEGSYHSVWRFVMRLGKATPVPFRRMETDPGEEAQIDFGTGAPVVSADGKKRRPWMFRIVLSHSRSSPASVGAVQGLVIVVHLSMSSSLGKAASEPPKGSSQPPQRIPALGSV